MSKKLKNNKNGINKIYLGALALVTVLFVVFLVITLIDMARPNDLTRIDNVSVEELQKRTLNDGTGTFYILVYTADNEENDLIVNQVIDYDKYADKKDEASPIVKIEYKTETKEALKAILPSDLNYETGLPCLITISGNKVSNTKTTVSTILETLESAKK